jgi:hypothetical protein
MTRVHLELKPAKGNDLSRVDSAWTQGSGRADRWTKTFILCRCTRRMVAMSINLAPQPQKSSARSFQRRSLPFILANWYSNNTGSSSHRHDRSFKLVRHHYDALSGPGHLSELRVILQFPRPPSDKDHFTTCVSISRLVVALVRRGCTAGSCPPKALSQGGRRAHQMCNSTRVSGVDWQLEQ